MMIMRSGLMLPFPVPFRTLSSSAIELRFMRGQLMNLSFCRSISTMSLYFETVQNGR